MSSIQQSRLSFSKRFTFILSLTEVNYTDRKLGQGSDAVVVEADHLGTLCAAKKLHQSLLSDDESSQSLVANFENEISTWYTLRHPHIVQLLGVHFEHGSRVPALILEKMETSLKNYIWDGPNKEEVPLPDKVFILRQVSQALAYLHSCQPPLVHHDLSPNNILLNQDSLLTKITDFGMSRAVDPSHSIRKSSVKGTLAFMSPEALVNPPKYTEKLDIFSFGNITLFTITHLYPEPGPSIVYEGDKAIAVEELQRREECTKSLTAEEHSLFFPMIRCCLENRPDRRPTSLWLVQQMRQIEKVRSRPDHSRQSHTIAQLTQQLQEKDDQLKENKERFKENNRLRIESYVQLQTMHMHIKILLREIKCIRRERDVPQHEADRVQSTAPTDQRSSPSPVQPLPTTQHHHKTPALPHSSSKPPPRNWKELQCQKLLKCGEACFSIAVQGDVVCVGLKRHVLFFSKTSDKCKKIAISELKLDQIEGVYGVAFIDEDTIVVSADKRLRTFTSEGQLVCTFDSGNSKVGFKGLTPWLGLLGLGNAQFYPLGLTVGPDGRIFVCDTDNHRVCVFNVDGKLLSSFGSKGSGVGRFNHPRDVCMSGEGLLFISDQDNRRICVYSIKGKFVREFSISFDPNCVAATHCNHLVVSSLTLHKVVIMTTSGDEVHKFGGSDNDLGQFLWPQGVAVDNEDCVYICDMINRCVQVYY